MLFFVLLLARGNGPASTRWSSTCPNMFTHKNNRWSWFWSSFLARSCQVLLLRQWLRFSQGKGVISECTSWCCLEVRVNVTPKMMVGCWCRTWGHLSRERLEQPLEFATDLSTCLTGKPCLVVFHPYHAPVCKTCEILEKRDHKPQPSDVLCTEIDSGGSSCTAFCPILWFISFHDSLR